MNNKISCVDPREKQKEMLRGQYKLIRSYRTEPAQLISTMAQVPLMYHLYKKRDFETKSVLKEDIMQSKRSD